MDATESALLALFLLFSGTALAQSAGADKDKAADKENEIAILELGPAVGHGIKGGGSSFGPNVAVEVTPIENWLELEGGVTRLYGRHSQEWDADLLFKKPWTLSRKAEFMVGVGPEWIHTSGYGMRTNSLGASAALDFMFWPSAKHKFGWYVEPAYD